MIKILVSLTTLVLLTTQTQAQVVLPAQVKCQIVQIGGRISSYLPPKVGDVIVIGIRNPILNELTFASKNNIPLLDPLKRQIVTKRTGNLVTYQAETRYPNGGQYSTSLQIAKVSNGQTLATIQQLSRESADTLWTFGQVNLKCQ